jgi:hypothetical protein
MAYPNGIKQKLFATRAYYGDLSDGNVTLISGTTTLTRDMYYKTITINSGATLSTANFRIFADMMINNGTIDNSGPSGSLITQGTATAAGSLIGGTSGGAGITQNAGGNTPVNPGANFAATLIGKGGKGGSGGTAGSSIGGAGGTLNPNAIGATYGVATNTPQGILGELIGSAGSSKFGGGTGGGGGGADVFGDTSGGGGSGGGFILVVCRALQGTGTISANGGNGGNGTAGGTGAGGGGGGGGGLIRIFSGDFSQWNGSLVASGGTGGTGTGVGASGSSGNSGVTNTIWA